MRGPSCHTHSQSWGLVHPQAGGQGLLQGLRLSCPSPLGPPDQPAARGRLCMTRLAQAGSHLPVSGRRPQGGPDRTSRPAPAQPPRPPEQGDAQRQRAGASGGQPSPGPWCLRTAPRTSPPTAAPPRTPALSPRPIRQGHCSGPSWPSHVHVCGCTISSSGAEAGGL